MILKTERTTISPLSTADFDEIIAMYNEPDSNQFIPHLHQKSHAFYEEFLSKKVFTNLKSVGFWTVRKTNTGAFIGTVNLNQFQDTDITHIGAHISRTYWNQGYAIELLTALINYGFETRNLETIHGIVSPNHTISKKLLERLGIGYYKDIEVNGENVHLHRLKRH